MKINGKLWNVTEAGVEHHRRHARAFLDELCAAPQTEQAIMLAALMGFIEAQAAQKMRFLVDPLLSLLWARCPECSMDDDLKAASAELNRRFGPAWYDDEEAA